MFQRMPEGEWKSHCAAGIHFLRLCLCHFESVRRSAVKLLSKWVKSVAFHMDVILQRMWIPPVFSCGILCLSFLLGLPQPRPILRVWGRRSTYNPAPRHDGVALVWSCCSLTHDHTDPWMGISAGFSKPNICASQHCHCSNHSLNQNTKSNFTWMPQHKYLIVAENKSLSFCSLSCGCGLLL